MIIVIKCIHQIKISNRANLANNWTSEYVLYMLSPKHYCGLTVLIKNHNTNSESWTASLVLCDGFSSCGTM